MKKIRIIREQNGQIMAMLLVILAVGGLLITSTLAMGSSGFKIQASAIQSTSRLYAADLGVQHALWWLQSMNYSQLPTDPGKYIDFPPAGVIDSNGMKVFAFLHYTGTVDELRQYSITSVAGPEVIHNHDLANQPAGYTKIVSYVTSASGDLTGIMNQAITSQNGYTIQGGHGGVNPPSGEHGPVANYAGIWPTGSQLYQFYWQRVKDVTPYGSSSFDVSGADSLGPFYRNGQLDIESGGSGATLTLHGPLFVNGDLQIGTTGQDFTLDLNGQTIYVNSNTVGLPYALQIGAKCTIKGSGAIIALGDIQFKPNIASGPSDYTLIMSVTGMSYLQPGGNFYGTVAGSTTVYDQNGTITWVDPRGHNIDVPGIGSQTIWSIRAWDISVY